MKHILPLVVLSLLFCCSLPTQAQKQFTEGMLQYDISITSSKTEAPIANSLNGAKLLVYLKPTMSRTEMKSSLGTESTVFDTKLSKGFILKEYSGQKLMISMNGSNWNDKNRVYKNLEFAVSNEVVEIAGYNCKKAVAKLPEGNVLTVYFNPDISLYNRSYNNAFAQLPGLPVQYELQSGNLNFKYLLSKISYDAVPQDGFEAPRGGFRVMTYDENQQLKKNGK
jgi:GLPGLI family protein